MTTQTPTPIRRAPRSPAGTGRTPKREVRLPDDEWAPVTELAAARGVTAASIVRDALAEYVKRHKH